MLYCGEIKNKSVMEYEYEYRDRSYEMWLEGTSDYFPIELEIIEHAKQKGYELQNIEIWFDNLQKFWRFSADLIKS